MTLAVQQPPEDLFLESIERLARGVPTSITGLFDTVEAEASITDTRVLHHCHRLKQDGNGNPRVGDLVNAICDFVLDYAIPRSSIASAARERQTTGSSAGIVRLTRQARQLFADVDRSGEGGELLLFVFAEALFRLPQLLCKMDFKTNSQSHFQGADGVHAGIDSQTGNLILYWGESKVYADPNDAIDKCVDSIAEFLNTRATGTPRAERDLQLLQRHADLDDPVLEEGLKRFLDSRGGLSSQVEFRGLCLVGFDCDAFGVAPSFLAPEDSLARVRAHLPQWRDRIKARTEAKSLSTFGMHFVSLPFPSVEAFRGILRAQLQS